ncbi:MAG: lipoprotein [Spiroplasma phoeniceum]|nr:MAG: lipoprotein [Spiroplasma phoeniceum]UZQ33466.1 MAG: lipoprotein [Spiroplasma phoeniceum]
MKKILSLLGTIALIVISTTSLVGCNTPQKYTPEELAKIKEQNNIKTKDGILNWIAPQEKPFDKIDNKYYFVIWRGNKKMIGVLLNLSLTIVKLQILINMINILDFLRYLVLLLKYYYKI